MPRSIYFLTLTTKHAVLHTDYYERANELVRFLSECFGDPTTVCTLLHAPDAPRPTYATTEIEAKQMSFNAPIVACALVEVECAVPLRFDKHKLSALARERMPTLPVKLQKRSVPVDLLDLTTAG